MASLDEAFKLPLPNKERKETLKSTTNVFRGSYKTYIKTDTSTYKRKSTNNSSLMFYQLKENNN